MHETFAGAMRPVVGSRCESRRHALKPQVLRYSSSVFLPASHTLPSTSSPNPSYRPSMPAQFRPSRIRIPIRIPIPINRAILPTFPRAFTFTFDRRPRMVYPLQLFTAIYARMFHLALVFPIRAESRSAIRTRTHTRACAASISQISLERIWRRRRPARLPPRTLGRRARGRCTDDRTGWGMVSPFLRCGPVQSESERRDELKCGGPTHRACTG